MTPPLITRRRFLRFSGTSALAFTFLDSFTQAADLPRTLDELWAGFPELDRITPLAAEVLKEWEDEEIVCRIVSYQVGVCKGAPSRVAGFYAFAKGGTSLAAVKELKGAPDWQPVSVSLSDLAATDPKLTAPLAYWRTVTEFSLSPSGDIVRDGQKSKVPGKAWQGPRDIRNLRWEGGNYALQQTPDYALTPAEHPKAFHDANQKSLEQEQAEQKAKWNEARA